MSTATLWTAREWRATSGTAARGGRSPLERREVVGRDCSLDITAPDETSATGGISLLWDNLPADIGAGNELGHVFQPGVIGSVRDTTAANGKGRWVYIVGNGFDSGSNEAYLLIIDALTGALVKRIGNLGGTAALPNGLGAVTPLYDGARNIVAVYAGDKHGNLWKFNLSSDDKTQWASALGTVLSPLPLFMATDGGGVAQPISSAPRITPHPLGGLFVMFGTGKLFEVSDPTDMQVQALYGLRDVGQVPASTPILKASLKQIRLEQFDLDGNPATPNDVFRRLNAADIAAYKLAPQNGFYIPLKATTLAADGERVIASPILDSGSLAVTSFSPTSLGDRCVPGGVSFLYRFDLSGAFSQNAFAGQGADVVGRRVSPGSVGGLPPLYDAIDPSGLAAIHAMSDADVKAMLTNPKYKLSGNRAVQQGATGVCAHVGMRVDGTIARIPTVCAGLMPLRSWRQVR